MEIKNVDVWGFKHAIRGMRNAFESWYKSDSDFTDGRIIIRKNDMTLCQNLLKGNSADWKFMRMIHVSADITLPRFIWSEFDTYHFNTKNSCSTMHKLLNNNNPITTDMFEYSIENKDLILNIVTQLENLRIEYKTTKDNNIQNKLLLMAKEILPESFLQMRTIDTNYAELRNIYFQRKNHRLQDWHKICEWIETLPYAQELICYNKDIDKC